MERAAGRGKLEVIYRYAGADVRCFFSARRHHGNWVTNAFEYGGILPIHDGTTPDEKRRLRSTEGRNDGALWLGDTV